MSVGVDEWLDEVFKLKKVCKLIAFCHYLLLLPAPECHYLCVTTQCCCRLAGSYTLDTWWMQELKPRKVLLDFATYCPLPFPIAIAQSDACPHARQAHKCKCQVSSPDATANCHDADMCMVTNRCMHACMHAPTYPPINPPSSIHIHTHIGSHPRPHTCAHP